GDAPDTTSRGPARHAAPPLRTPGTAARAGGHGVVPAAGQRRDQLGAPGAGAPRVRGPRGAAGGAHGPGDVRRLPRHHRARCEPAVLPRVPGRPRDAWPAPRDHAGLPPGRGPPRLARAAGTPGGPGRRGAGHPRRRGLPDGPRRLRRAVRRRRGRARDAGADPSHPPRGGPDPGAVHGQRRPARGARRPEPGALAARRRPRAVRPEPAQRGAARRARAPGRGAGGVRRPAGRREGAGAARPRPPPPGCPRRRGRRRPGGAAAAGPAAPRGVPGRAPRHRARTRARQPRRLRPHRPSRDLLPGRSGGPGVRCAGRGATCGWTAGRRGRRGRRPPLRAGRRRRPGGVRRGPGARPDAAAPDGARGPAERAGTVVAGRHGSPGAPLPGGRGAGREGPPGRL
ncbi:MAG: Glycosyltransferase, partial [uncultured Nocardioides sp.]